MSADVDIPMLLEPISDDRPGGADLRDDDDPNNIFRRVKDARNAARQEESQSDVEGELTSSAGMSEWRQVWEEGQEYLRNQAKDLEIAAYMIEASIRLGGYRGLAQSLELTRELVNRFWGELLPTPDEDGIETTVLPISRLNGDVITYPLMRVPMTDDGSFGHLVLWQYTQAQQLDSLSASEREVRIARGAITMEQYRQAVAESSDAFYRQLKSEIEAAQAALKSVNEIFEEKAGYEFAPNLSKFESSLTEAMSVLQQIAGERLVEESAVDESSDEDARASADSASSGGEGAPKKQGVINSREEAFGLLEKVAAWIEKNEPQSLLPSEIRKVIRRGKMSPLELYKDLIRDSDVRNTLYRDVGIEIPEDEY